MLSKFLGKGKVLLIPASWLNAVASILNKFSSPKGTVSAKLEGDGDGSTMNIDIVPSAVAREIGNGYVAIEAETPDLLSIKSALLQQDNPVFGTNGRHYDVARSQRTKLNKTGAGLKQRLKWAAFAVKCWLEDLKKE